jgi:DNA repair exonuclease SbcCD ATPase subunit
MTEPHRPNNGSQGLNLPRPQRIALRNFSLYDNAPLVEADFGRGVFCLAGANGLGKSTFLAALNYAITGIVADPTRRFESVQEYYRKSQPYSADFFRGRIAERDAPTAQVELLMSVGLREYRIVRGMFDPTGLLELEIREPSGELETFDEGSIDDAERHDRYAETITADVGLDSFAQLAFLQHFVFTFDERRHLLFWDERVAQAALYVTFGVDIERADRADTLRRTMERADSLARNLQWQATDLRKRLNDVANVLTPADEVDDDLALMHQTLQEEQAEVADRVDSLEGQVEDVIVRLADGRALQQAAIAEYEFAFRRQILGRQPANKHPAVATALESSECAVCGAHGPEVERHVAARLRMSVCPLCNTKLPSYSEDTYATDPSIARLAQLEAQVVERTATVEESMEVLTRLRGALSSAKEQAEQLATRLSQFERENEALLLRTSSDATLAATATEHFRGQIADIMSRKRQQLDRRNEARRELASLQAELALAYSAAEATFVPRFTDLAREFLGIDLDIRLQTNPGGAHLILTVQGTTRRAHDSLSESQRFFVDIALRMALAQQMTDSNQSACLFIDTPEGSLDIAYESRAGSMFGQFVTSGHQLIMTANINTSQLLRKLATTCGPERMSLMRMTNWTSLSEVQSSEEQLFDSAYAEIEAALEAGG